MKSASSSGLESAINRRMQVTQGVREVLAAPQGGFSFSPSVVTIGNFDGVHLGHQVLIRRLIERAREKNLPAIVFTFEPHPIKVLHPEKKLHRIFDLDDQIEQLTEMGVDALVIEPFSRKFSQLKPETFLLEWLMKPFAPESLIVGYDFSFGANRQGSIDFLKEHAPSLGTRVEVVPPFKVGDVIVSSSRIRTAIEAGDVAQAGRFLGRSFYLSGVVERGAGRGRSIGVPTANLRSMAETVPASGVYAAWASVGDRRFPAAVNIGFNPTFVDPAAAHVSIEAHLIGFSGDLYGERLQLDFVERVREERKFVSAAALVARIKEDIVECSRILGSRG